MNISMQLAVVVAAACLCLADAAPDARMTRKSQRPTRGFKNVEMMTARGFGKRDHPTARSEQIGLDNFWNILESSEGEAIEGEEKYESVPLEWFVNEMLKNPDLTRSVIRKFIDLNQDGMLSIDELLRNVA